MRFHILTILLLLASLSHTRAQDWSSLRTMDILPGPDSINFPGQRSAQVLIHGDSIILDSLIIQPGSVFLYSEEGLLLADSLYELDPLTAVLRLDHELHNQRLLIRYRIMDPEDFKTFRHRDAGVLKAKPGRNAPDPFRITAEDLTAGSYFSYSELNKRGNLSRGVSFGNNQDVVVNSNLNLQLTGKLSDNLNIIAAISDNNIPIQPDGYSQQLSEFDKVYLEVFNEQMGITGGDFELQGSPGMFMDFYKRAQGARFKGKFEVGRREHANVQTTLSGAISKGKFSRNQFMGMEGNQGPYKLQGANFESFIIVLAGSERVFIDGRRMTRGIDQDYIIDYNNAEIRFTPSQPITKDKRIIVEFEYSERSYARFLVYNSNEFLHRNGSLFLNVYSEQDDKNQSLQQDLSEDDKYFLSQIGNDLSKAVVPGVDSVGWSENEVRYQRTDSLVDGQVFPGIFVWSTDPMQAHYRLRFSFVGQGRGDYLPLNTVANGRVYQWVAPVNGQHQGTHEPAILLVTPKKQQVVSFGGKQEFSTGTRIRFETALSNNDLNTFSSLNQDQNLGLALNARLDQELLSADTNRIRLVASAAYRHTGERFSTVERFRSVEFARDWNLPVDTASMKEQFIEGGLRFYQRDHGHLAWNTELLSLGSAFQGNRNSMNGALKLLGFDLSLNGSLMNAESRNLRSRFLRHRMILQRPIGPLIAGVREEGEYNRRALIPGDSLAPGSFAFQEFEVFLTQPDSLPNRGTISFNHRNDLLPFGDDLRLASTGQDLKLGYQLSNNPNNRLLTRITYRELSIRDTLVSTSLPEQTMLGRIEHGWQDARGAIRTSTFYEVGSGLEARREYSYLEVPPGQGVYTWIDYNQNDIRELDEFEIAAFKDEARYIRIFLPSDDFITAYTNQFNFTMNLTPARVWKSRTGLRKSLSWFSNQFAYRINRKNARKDILKNLNPLHSSLNDPDLISLASSIRNNLSFNKSGKIFGADYLYQQNQGRTLLSNGFDTRTQTTHGLKTRISIEQVSLLNQFNLGSKQFKSTFLSNRNYDIGFLSNQASAQFQLSMALRLVLEYRYNTQLNRLDVQESTGHTLGSELRFSKLNKGVLTIRGDYVYLDYNDATDTPVAYEMLQGLLPGNNGTWTLLFQRSIIAGIELNIEYSGRVSENQRVIHSGGLQVRASF